MVTFDQRDRGRDNNFNLLRLIAASGVLVSHAWPIALGTHAREPLEDALGISLGTVSVIAFFAISGYFIAKSMARRESTAGFIRARLLRLFPGLLVCLALTAFVLGPLVTTAGHGAYWPAVPGYVAGNFSLYKVVYPLPGVFADNPLGPPINGSLWSLRFEFTCYIGVMLAGLAGLLTRKPAMLAIWLVTLAAFVVGRTTNLNHFAQMLTSLAFPFFTGSAIWALRERLPMSPLVPLALAAVALLARAIGGTDNTVFAVLLVVAIAWACLWFGFARLGLSGFNRLGDCSYGVYIYAYPVQQTIAWALPPMREPALNIALSLPIVLVLSAASWMLIEHPALRLKSARRPAPAAASGPLRVAVDS